MSEDALRIIEDRIVAWRAAQEARKPIEAESSRLFKIAHDAEKALLSAIGYGCSVVVNGICYTNHRGYSLEVTKASFVKGAA